MILNWIAEKQKGIACNTFNGKTVLKTKKNLGCDEAQAKMSTQVFSLAGTNKARVSLPFSLPAAAIFAVTQAHMHQWK